MKKLNQTEMLHIRVTNKEKKKIEESSYSYKFRSVSDYIRFLALNDWNIKVENINGK
jgi:hypothetical protein